MSWWRCKRSLSVRKFTGDSLVIATHNAGKLTEIAELLAPYGVKVVGAAEMGLAEPEETETTFAGNARIKAHAAAQATRLPALSDDSGIEINDLGNAPGVYTADWAETDQGRDFAMAMAKVHGKLLASGAEKPWKARFCCTLVLAWPDGHDEVFTGVVEGQITWPMQGDQGHGYDPIFVPDGYDITFAEMPAPEKNRISHRADAFAKLVTGCFA